MTNKEAFDRGVKRWADNVQVDENLKALSDIRAILDIFFSKGYSFYWDMDEVINKIEEICCKVKDRKNDIVFIEKFINKHYEELGREPDTPKPTKMILLKKLNEYLEKKTIPSNYLIISKLKYEEFLEEENV